MTGVGTYVRRYIEAAFRLKFRLLIGAALVFGVVSAALYLAKQGYGASATVWVEQPIYFADTGMTKNWNPYMTPADNQANILQELLRTRQFALNVANGAQIPMPNEVVENRVLDDLQKGMRIESQGTHLIKISYSAEKPTYCKVLVEQVIMLFTEQLNASRAEQADVALELYKKQKDTYEAQMQKSRDALSRYIQANPESVTAGSAPNPQLVALQQQYESDRSSYEEVTQKIERVTIDATTAGKLSEQFFRMIDAPSDPEPNMMTVKQLITNSALALVMSLMLMVGVTLLGAWTDPAIYSAHEITGLAPVAEDGSTPELLVAAVPTVPQLVALRRVADKAARAAKKAKGKGKAEAAPAAAPVPPAEGEPAPAVPLANIGRLFEGLTLRAGAHLPPSLTTTAAAPATPHQAPRRAPLRRIAQSSAPAHRGSPLPRIGGALAALTGHAPVVAGREAPALENLAPAGAEAPPPLTADPPVPGPGERARFSPASTLTGAREVSA